MEDHWKERPGRALANANGDSSLRPTAWMESWEGRGGEGVITAALLTNDRSSHLSSSQHSGGSYGDPDASQLQHSEVDLILRVAGHVT